MDSEIKYTFWQDNNFWIGYLDDYPDYWTQGNTIAELEENLLDLFKEFSGGSLPRPRRSGTLKIA
jgi:predicted RNase H-like HicB family nuclease